MLDKVLIKVISFEIVTDYKYQIIKSLFHVKILFEKYSDMLNMKALVGI